jgi:hypothetical protein
LVYVTAAIRYFPEDDSEIDCIGADLGDCLAKFDFADAPVFYPAFDLSGVHDVNFGAGSSTALPGIRRHEFLAIRKMHSSLDGCIAEAFADA